MKKLLCILTIFLFIGINSVTAFASTDVSSIFDGTDELKDVISEEILKFK